MAQEPEQVESQKMWENIEFNPGDMKHPLLEESSFATLFPKYREKYLRSVWPLLEKELHKYGIEAILDLREGTMTVKTTRKTWDPYAIMNARDIIKLLSRSVPIQQALKVFDDKVFCDIIKIGRITGNKERFIKRRERLIGPNGQTLKAIELLSGCYVLVQGNTVSAMGTPKGLALVRKIVEECMRNIHPIYNIKAEMIKREIAKNPDMKDEDWNRFIPSFKKKNAQRKVKKVTKKKTKSIFPPPQTLRKVDYEMMSGEYFLSPQEKESAKQREKEQKQAEKAQERKKEREKAFVPPKEQRSKGKDSSNESDLQDSIAKIKSASSKNSNKRKASSDNLGDYVDAPQNKKRRSEKQ